MKQLLTFSSLIVCALLLAPKCSASNLVFSDNFDRKELSDWTTVRSSQSSNQNLPCLNENNRAEWKIVDGMATITLSGPSCITEAVPSLLDLSSNEEYQVSFDWFLQNSTHMDRNFAFLWIDKNNWLDLKLIDDSILVQAVQDGQARIVSNSDKKFNFMANNLYHFDVNYAEKGHHIKVTINGQTLIDTEEVSLKPYIGKKTFAMQASSGALTYSTTSFDNIVVSIPDAPTTLGVEHIGQGDEPWGSTEYDSAAEWSSSGTTFKDWGCALTSTVMIMRYHGITTMPSGDPVNPLTVNDWLKENHGYINGGLVSFASISALTKEISDKNGTPVLEYSRANVTPLEAALAAVDLKQPAILQIPGHFIVAEGRVTTDKNDAYIQDPASTSKQLSLLKKDPTSARLLTPSHTDVSFIEISADPLTQLSLQDLNGTLASTAPSIDFLTDDSRQDAVATSVQLLEISKPATGSYRLKVTPENSTALPTQVKLIGPHGETNVYLLPDGVQTVQLNITTTGGTVLIQDRYGFSTFRTMLHQIKTSDGILNNDNYRLLDLIAAQGEIATDTGEMKILTKMLRQLLEARFRSTFVTETDQKSLVNQLKKIDAALKGKAATQWIPATSI